MNILIYNWRDVFNPKAGGAEYVTFKHAEEWVKRGHSVTWFSSSFKDASKYDTKNGISFVRFGNLFSTFLFAPFYYIFSKTKFDLVIDEIHGLPFFTPLYVRKPKIAFIHEVAGPIWDLMYPFPLSKFGKIFERYYFKLYNSVPFWTDAPSTIYDLEAHGIKKKNCYPIPCPIDNSSLNKLPQKEKNPTYIFVSRIVKMKGIEDVLYAFSAIQKKHPESQFWVVGGGDEKYISFLKKLTRELKIKNIKFFGWVSNKEKLRLMRRSHILLHASVREGWGLVILEAASQATPSVVYKVAGLVDTVKNGITGVVVKNNTPDNLAEEAVVLISDAKKYKTFQENGLKWASSFSWKSVTNQSLKLINLVCKNR